MDGETLDILPSRIIIGGTRYRLIERTALWRKAEGVDGQVRFDDLEVDIVTEARPYSEILNTLMHELCHVVWREYHLPGRPREERTVTVMGFGWAALLIQNPELHEVLGVLADGARDNEA